VFPGDLSHPATPARLVAEVRDTMGSLAVLVNSASSFQRTPLATLTTPQWDEVLAVNLRAPFFLALEASRIMTTGGCIVNVSDHLAAEYTHGYVAHGIAKAGVRTMTRMLAAQLAPRVRVNAIVPGVVLPPDNTSAAALDALAGEAALRRNGTPRDVVLAVEYLIDAEFVTGELLTVDGGRALMR
jgi:NAD(P)-dependent dehydrogenase (short-subunit alcohol dehydrogenase family)